MPSQYYFPPYNKDVTFSKWDVVQGDGIRSADLTYYYSLVDRNLGNLPTGRFNIPITSYSRTDDVTTLYFTQGSNPTFYQGSIIYVTGMANTSLNYTGMITAAGQGSVSFTNPGWTQGVTATSIGAISGRLNPSWTTGFAFVPAYQTKSETTNSTVTAQLGDGYSQRMPNGINSYMQSFNFVYTSRGNRETRAIDNFVTNMAGSAPFEIMFPVASLVNKPGLKYVAPNVSYTTDSWGLNTATVTLQRVFDP
jgi:phage-related protein